MFIKCNSLYEPTVMFFGFCNYYWRFVVAYSEAARPLHRLTGKEDWVWTDEQQKAFERLKGRICEDAVIAVPTMDDRFRVEADSLNFANGAILSQCINGKWRPVAFRSQSLSQAERNYEIYDKEMLAIMAAIEEWRPYLLGASQPFEIWTDHRNLQYFRKPQKLNYRQARWVITLQDYDFQLSHRPGALMTKADLLSRRADHYQGEDDNCDIVLLKPEVFAGEIMLEALDTDFVRRAKCSAQNRDREVVKALVNRTNDWEETAEGLVVWKHRLYVPKDDRLHTDILKAHHDAPTVGHPGRYKTQELIT